MDVILNPCPSRVVLIPLQNIIQVHKMSLSQYLLVIDPLQNIYV